MNNKEKILNSFIVGAIASIVFITLITVAADIFPLLKDFLKINFYHHWIGKGVLAIFVFIIVYGFFFYSSRKKESRNKLSENLWTLVAVSALGTFSIFFFYIIETYLSH